MRRTWRGARRGLPLPPRSSPRPATPLMSPSGEHHFKKGLPAAIERGVMKKDVRRIGKSEKDLRERLDGDKKQEARVSQKTEEMEVSVKAGKVKARRRVNQNSWVILSEGRLYTGS